VCRGSLVVDSDRGLIRAHLRGHNPKRGLKMLMKLPRCWEEFLQVVRSLFAS
jgi:hypothetical protein